MAAVTAKPYGAFLNRLTIGNYNLQTISVSVMLATSAYTPAYGGAFWANEVGSAELPAGNGYTTGGQQLQGLSYAYSTITGLSTLTANDLTWASLTGTVRYAILYESGGHLMGCIDFGADHTYAASPLQLSFPNGVLTVGASS